MEIVFCIIPGILLLTVLIPVLWNDGNGDDPEANAIIDEVLKKKPNWRKIRDIANRRVKPDYYQDDIIF